MNPILAPMKDCDTRDVCGVQVDVHRAGTIRVKRMIYPVGFHWSNQLSEKIGSEYCMHAHVGFMAHGQINVEFQDGCVEEYRAPKFVAVEPGHKGWVVGDEPAVLIEFDFEGETVDKVSLPVTHTHK